MFVRNFIHQTGSRNKRGLSGLTMLMTLIAAAAIAFTTGCGGGGGNSPTPPVLTGNTLVTVVLSGTANDQLTEFDLGVQSLTLTSQSGNTVSLLSTYQGTEFMHINGQIEPLVTVSIPQGVYTAATAMIGGAQFSCADFSSPDTLDTSTFAYGQTPQANVTVNLPAPITITGNSMGLSLNLLVAQSATYATCFSDGGIDPYSITPTFNLTPVAFSAQPANPGNGKVNGLNGQISSINTLNNSFMLSLPSTTNIGTVSVSSAGSTAYQGIGNFSDLAVGTFVNMDGAVQSDGSLLATRIAVEDTTETTVVTGPLLQVSGLEPALLIWGRQQQGALYAGIYVLGGQYFSFGNTAFQISGQLANLDDLPFMPSFDGSNMVPGQNVYLSTASTLSSGGFPYTPLSTITLIPQTIDGTVEDSSDSGNFTIYTVDLASYDLFPMLAVQPGQTTLLNNPDEVEVYVDSNTQQLNSQPVTPGNTLRFYGLVFNDNGALRMDCAQVNDGVSETPLSEPTLRNHLENGRATVVRSGILGTVHETSRVITPAQ